MVSDHGKGLIIFCCHLVTSTSVYNITVHMVSCYNLLKGFYSNLQVTSQHKTSRFYSVAIGIHVKATAYISSVVMLVFHFPVKARIDFCQLVVKLSRKVSLY